MTAEELGAADYSHVVPVAHWDPTAVQSASALRVDRTAPAPSLTLADLRAALDAMQEAERQLDEARARGPETVVVPIGQGDAMRARLWDVLGLDPRDVTVHESILCPPGKAIHLPRPTPLT